MPKTTTKAKPKSKAAPMGRPTAYTEALAEKILIQLSDGLSLRKICAKPGFPDRRTIERWQESDTTFAAKCARAREEQAEHHHAAMDDIEAKVLSGKLNPKAASVVLANKRWRMEKLKPKAYGQKIGHEISGPGGGPVRTITTEMTPQEAAAAYASTLNGE
ncbi:terminase small subunit-like protein [Xanthomonas arboricola pv. corylina]|uniref:terminase small subunit-like protein n=1 Tax=Xanthomonas arboricola TaxID=56448 RepID=UPI000CEDAB4C|nr:hypothetical protein [Xanthomonas arboricola]PPU15812.1 hypothetical protein XacyCFBP2565_08440 [Xanthomonas arboricola pv. corylina]PPU46777.1 hypothetical protein XarbCFBP7697_14080 [Xanthomonas arboricola]